MKLKYKAYFEMINNNLKRLQDANKKDVKKINNKNLLTK